MFAYTRRHVELKLNFRQFHFLPIKFMLKCVCECIFCNILTCIKWMADVTRVAIISYNLFLKCKLFRRRFWFFVLFTFFPKMKWISRNDKHKNHNVCKKNKPKHDHILQNIIMLSVRGSDDGGDVFNAHSQGSAVFIFLRCNLLRK